MRHSDECERAIREARKGLAWVRRPVPWHTGPRPGGIADRARKKIRRQEWRRSAG